MTWRDRAACLGVPTDLFFPARGDSAAEAKQICADCPVIGECREWALRQGPQLIGVYAALTGKDRRPLHRAQKQTRRTEPYPQNRAWRIPNGSTKKHLARLLDAGWTHVRIGEACGVPWQTVTSQLRGDVGSVDEDFAGMVAGLSTVPGRPLCCAVCGHRLGTHPLEGHVA